MTAPGVRRLTGRDEVRALLRRHPERHLLALGDLDDAFWPHTEFHHGHGQTLMIYTGLTDPVVIAVADPPETAMTRLAADCVDLLPDHFYGHLSPEALAGLRDAYEVAGATTHAYMTLRGPVTLGAGSDVVTLGEADLPEITALQAAANPHGGFFEPAMLRAGPYLGVRRAGELVSMAGTHTWSPAERVAVLGNIATHPGHRGRGHNNFRSEFVIFDDITECGFVAAQQRVCIVVVRLGLVLTLDIGPEGLAARGAVELPNHAEDHDSLASVVIRTLRNQIPLAVGQIPVGRSRRARLRRCLRRARLRRCPFSCTPGSRSGVICTSRTIRLICYIPAPLAAFQIGGASRPRSRCFVGSAIVRVQRPEVGATWRGGSLVTPRRRVNVPDWTPRSHLGPSVVVWPVGSRTWRVATPRRPEIDAGHTWRGPAK